METLAGKLRMVVIVGLAIVGALASAASASAQLPEFNLLGVVGSLTGNYTQITSMDMTTGVYSGTANNGGEAFTVTGTMSGDVNHTTFALVPQENPAYYAYDHVTWGILADGNIGGPGAFTDTNGTTATYTTELNDPEATEDSDTAVSCSTATGTATTSTCTATVTGEGGTPTGNITWGDGSAGGTFSAPACQLASGSCSVTYTPPTAGAAFTITATYSADATFKVSQGSVSTISGTLANRNCSTGLCTPTPAAGVTVNVQSAGGGGGVSTSATSDSQGNWSVQVPPGAYNVTPVGSGWDPQSLRETVPPGATGVNFARCGSAAGSTAADATGAFGDVLASAASASSCTKVTINNASTLAMGGPLKVTGTGWSIKPGAGPVSLYLTDSTGHKALIATEGVTAAGSFTNTYTVKQWSQRATYPNFKDGCELDLDAEQGTTTAQTSVTVAALGGVVYYKGTSTRGYKNGDVYCTGEDPLSESNGSLMVLAPNDGPASGSPLRLLVDDPGASITVHNGDSGGVSLEPGHSLCIGFANPARFSSNAIVISATSSGASARPGTSSRCASSSPLNPSVASVPATGVASDCGGLVAMYIGAQLAAGSTSIGGNAVWQAHGNLSCTDHYIDANLNYVDDFYVSSVTINGNFRLDTKLETAGSVAVSGALLLGGGVSAPSIAAGGDISLLLGPTPHLSAAAKKELSTLSDLISRKVGTPLTYLGVPVGGLGVLTGKIAARAGWVGWVMAIVGAKLTWDANTMADLASDPPDRDYGAKTTATTPSFAGTAPHGGLAGAATKALDVLSANSARTLGLERALGTAVDRASGAADAGDTAAERSQLQAAAAFASQLAPLQLVFLSDLRAARRTLSVAHLAAFKIPASAVSRLTGATRRSGLPAATVRLLERAGINSNQVAALRSQIDTLPDRSVTITFPTVTPQLVTAIKQQVAILKAFAARMRTNPLAPVQP